MKKEISILLNRRKSKISRLEDPLSNLWEKIYRGVLLVDFAEKSQSRRIKSESRRQFIITLVTAFEVYIVDLVKELIDKNKIDINNLKLSARDIPFREVLNLIKYKATVGETLCAFTNFQNIESVYDFLTGTFGLKPDFKNYLRAHTFRYLDKSSKWQEINFEIDFNEKLNKIFTDRHAFVHDLTFRGTPTYKFLNFSRRLIIDFAFSIEILANKFRHNRTCEILEKN